MENHFLTMIHSVNLEYGYRSPLDDFIEEHLLDYPHATRAWIEDMFIRHLNNIPVTTAILRTMAHMDPSLIGYQGLHMATIAINHYNTHVVDCGVRLIETIANAEALAILRSSQRTFEKWMRDYIDQVIIDIEKGIIKPEKAQELHERIEKNEGTTYQSMDDFIDHIKHNTYVPPRLTDVQKEQAHALLASRRKELDHVDELGMHDCLVDPIVHIKPYSTEIVKIHIVKEEEGTFNMTRRNEPTNDDSRD